MTKKGNKFPLYFYLNGQLHKKLLINRSQDTITTWCYPLGKRVAYTYSDVRRRKRPAFKTKEVSKMLNRSVDSIEDAIINGDIPRPQRSYGLDEHRRGHAFYWSEEDVLAAHDYYSTVHRGRPRKDGLIRPQAMPSRRELMAIMRNEDILYIKTEDGDFRPVWQAKEF